MANPNIIQGDLVVTGNLMPGGIQLPSGIVTGNNVSSQAAGRIQAGQVVHQFPVKTAQADGADVVSRTEQLHIALGAGTVIDFSLALTVAPSGGNKLFTVDLQKSTGGGAFASLLTSPITVDTTKTALTRIVGALAATPTYVAGDLLRIVVVASGSTGSQGQGLIARAAVQENPS
jgi:hypothetical protein